MPKWKTETPTEYSMTDTRNGIERSFTEEFFVDRSPAEGPGWYVFGREPNRVIKIVARPDVPRRHHPHYNVAVRRGWHRKYEALEIVAILNRKYNKEPK